MRFTLPEIGARFDEACDRLTTAGAILDFIIVAFVVFAITKAVMRPDKAQRDG